MIVIIISLFINYKLFLQIQNEKVYVPTTPVEHTKYVNKTQRININTRPVDSYTQIGLLYNDLTRLPLYGRQTYRGSHMWNYYTKSNEIVVLKIPIIINERNCENKYGCKEIYDDDEIYISEYNQTFKVRLYEKVFPIH
tara:strand:- start:869 stop:1285 length:417 start_codon:yes stop_codon:yes gene_type:complete